MMETLLGLGFLQRALAAGMFLGLACALLGVFLVLKKDAMLGHGLSHVTFAGVALALAVGALPLAVALAAAVFAAVVLSWLKNRAGLYGDTAIGIFSSVSLAAGVLLVSLSRKFNISLLGYLFGEILAVQALDVWLSAGLAVAAAAAVLAGGRRLMYVTFDAESARAAGVPTRRLDLILSILAAVTVVLGTKIVGLLLVSALLVIPAAAGLQVATSFRRALGYAAVTAVLSVTGGIAAAFALDLPASATVVLLSFLLFCLSLALRRGRLR
jgi:zinc transport system permease protein